MNQHQEQLFRVMFDVRKNARNLSFSDNLPPAVFHCLMVISKYGKEIEFQGKKCQAIDGRELFEKLHVSKPAISRCLKQCEAKGFVVRQNNHEDRRAMIVVLLEKGQQELEVSKEQAKQSASWIFDEIGQDDVEDLIRIFHKMNLVIQQFKERKQ